MLHKYVSIGAGRPYSVCMFNCLAQSINSGYIHLGYKTDNGIMILNLRIPLFVCLKWVVGVVVVAVVMVVVVVVSS